MFPFFCFYSCLHGADTHQRMLIILALDFASPYKYNEGKKDIIPFLPYKWTRHKIIDLKILHTLFDMRIHLSKSRTWEMFQNFWKINCHKKSSLMNVKTTTTVDDNVIVLFNILIQKYYSTFKPSNMWNFLKAISRFIRRSQLLHSKDLFNGKKDVSMRSLWDFNGR